MDDRTCEIHLTGKNARGRVALIDAADRDRWRAVIRPNGRARHLGYFANARDAAMEAAT